MKGKTFIILGLGAAGGFVYGNAFAFSKMMNNDKMRESFSSILADKISNILFGDEPSINTTRSVRYRDFYNKTRRPSCYAAAGIVFNTRADAEKVLDQMHEIIENYGCVRIQDFYDLCGSIINVNFHFALERGWTTLDKVVIRKHKDGWIIDFPETVRLDIPKKGETNE